MALHPEDPGFVVGFTCGALLGAIIVGGIGTGFHSKEVESMRAKCVENGAAHYDAKTGAFTWKNEVTE